MTEDTFWDSNSLMKYIPLTKSTIYSMVSRNQIPYRKIGKKLIFNKEDINNWIDKGGRNNTTEENLPTIKL